MGKVVRHLFPKTTFFILDSEFNLSYECEEVTVI